MKQGETSARSIGVIIAAGALVLALSFGVRSVFGAVVEPISAEFGSREIFSLSLAIQNLVWGLAQPAFGMIADRFGDRRALWLGFLCYILGMVLSAWGMTPMAQHLGAGVLVGAGVAGTAFGLVLSVVGRASSPERRSQNLGLVSALGSMGQVVMPLLAAALMGEGPQTPAAEGEIAPFRWMLWTMAALVLPMALAIPFLKAPEPRGGGAHDEPPMSTAAALKAAFGYSSYNLLVLGFFVCGFHVAFITVHFPAFVSEQCGDPGLGLQAIGVVGFMNVLGTFAAGQLGARFPKPYLLSAIYALRAVVIVLFISLPVTPVSVMLFAVAIGPLWLSTVPLTSGVVAGMFGPRHMATLFGFVFLGHQLGASLGVWLGGRLYDAFGSYDGVWWLAVALGVLSAIIHLPVDERAYVRRRAAV